MKNTRCYILLLVSLFAGVVIGSTLCLTLPTNYIAGRNPQFIINPIFTNRWSPRAFSGKTISQEVMNKLFEAARWAASSFNHQPWRFVYVTRYSAQWQQFLNLLVPFNQMWARNAGALVVIISKKIDSTSVFETGAAYENLVLQAELLDLATHGMAGFDYDRARSELNIPDDYTIVAMVAIGYPGNKEDLPAELQEREFPSDRMKVDEIAFEGTFKN